MSSSFVGIHEKDNKNRKMVTFVENSKYIERCEFEMIGNKWVQVDRAISYKKIQENDLNMVDPLSISIETGCKVLDPITPIRFKGL